jgi:hypothetical protein
MALDDAAADAPSLTQGVNTCRNCGALAPGNFCSECGQSTHIAAPSIGEFLHEFVAHHIALEGKLFASLKRLLLTPGGLTIDFFAGKRARYITPLRLYLTLNVIFFLAVELAQSLAGSAPINPAERAEKARAAHVATRESFAELSSALEADQDLAPEKRRAIEEKIAKVNGAVAALPLQATDSASVGADPGAAKDDIDSTAKGEAIFRQNFQNGMNAILPGWLDTRVPAVRKHLDAFANLSSDERVNHLEANLVHYAPYTLLMMLPVCALLLEMAFVGSKRRYVEHLVAALHGHTFLFIVLLVLLPLGGFSGLLFLIAIAHMVLALRKIYPGSLILLPFRLGFLLATYSIALMFATLIALAASVIT